ncbi:MAG: hypothetical protein ACOCUV_01050 [bacterium]
MFDKGNKVIVVDDKIEEARPLIDVLIQNEYPTVYYTGDLDKLPKVPHIGIRLIFLDIQLATEATNNKSKISTFLTVFKRIVSLDNGPIIVITWTENRDLHEELMSKLRDDAKYVSLLGGSISKSEVLENKDKDIHKTSSYDQDKIFNRIEKILSKNPALDYLFEWERINRDAISEAINRIYDLSESSEGKLYSDIPSILNTLGKEYNTENRNDKTSILKNSFLAINTFLQDVTINCIEKAKCNSKLELGGENSLNLRQKARINRVFMIDESININIFSPGSVFKPKTDSQDTFCSDISDLVTTKSESFHSDFAIPVLVVVTAICDFQNKKHYRHRIVGGYLIVKNDNFPNTLKFEVMNKNVLKKSLYTYISPFFYFQDKQAIFILDYRSFSSMDDNTEISDFDNLFRIRKEYLIDIQAGLAKHIYRPGIFALR